MILGIRQSLQIFMQQKTYSMVTAVVFLIIAIVHAIRMIMGLEVVVGDMMVPPLVSLIAIVGAGFLAYSGFRIKNV